MQFSTIVAASLLSVALAVPVPQFSGLSGCKSSFSGCPLDCVYFEMLTYHVPTVSGGSGLSGLSGGLGGLSGGSGGGSGGLSSLFGGFSGSGGGMFSVS